MSHVVTRFETRHESKRSICFLSIPPTLETLFSHCGFTFLHLQTVESTTEEIERTVDMFDAAKKGRIEDIRFAISMDPDSVNTKSSVMTLRCSPVHSICSVH